MYTVTTVKMYTVTTVAAGTTWNVRNICGLDTPAQTRSQRSLKIDSLPRIPLVLPFRFHTPCSQHSHQDLRLSPTSPSPLHFLPAQRRMVSSKCLSRVNRTRQATAAVQQNPRHFLPHLLTVRFPTRPHMLVEPEHGTWANTTDPALM